MFPYASFSGVPSYILALEEFGVGTLEPEDREERCRMLRTLMKSRGTPGHPTFSVVVPAHKESDYLLATLRSLAEQTNRDTEFLIVSNGEPKGNATQRLAEEAGFTVIHEPLAGVGRARHVGLLAARGDVVVTTDADTLHDPGWIDAIAEHRAAARGMIAGFGRVHAISFSPSYRFCTHTLNVSRALLAERFFFCAAEANAWFEREAGLAVGGYDVHARYAEGAKLFRKLAARGKIRCAWQDAAAVYTSDRRSMFARAKTLMHFLRNADARWVPYAVVR